MLATLVIGLREGLEAALVVGIVAAFLKRNGRSLAAMWIGVSLAIAASLAVGGGLFAFEAALPQAAQEGLETVIGAIAVVFVTGMLLWMNTHGRTMKRELEDSASAALRDGTAVALAVMAFLAVLKEGFETSVFLLATFRAAVTPGAAAIGALIGIIAAAAIGYGIYAGGVRLNLARFFRVTNVFLLLVAAGLTLTAVRTAHEAGWLTGGQQRTVDLGWLAPAGSVQAALITGVLGIPADPRVIEVIAWFAYVVPTALVLLLPASARARGVAALRLRVGLVATLLGAAGSIAAAAALTLAPVAPVAITLPETAGSTVHGTVSMPTDGTVRIVDASSVTTVPVGAPVTTEWRGLTVAERTGTISAAAQAASPMTLAALIAANGGRSPVGVDPSQDPGPFTATVFGRVVVTVRTAGDRVVDAAAVKTSIVTLTGGGLSTTRTVTLGRPVTVSAPASEVDAAVRAATTDAAATSERPLWTLQVPAALVIAALVLVVSTTTPRRRASFAAAPTGRTSYALK